MTFQTYKYLSFQNTRVKDGSYFSLVRIRANNPDLSKVLLDHLAIIRIFANSSNFELSGIALRALRC